MSGDGFLIIYPYINETLIVWDWQLGKELYRLSKHSGDITAVSVSDDGSLAVPASSDRILKV